MNGKEKDPISEFEWQNIINKSLYQTNLIKNNAAYSSLIGGSSSGSRDEDIQGTCVAGVGLVRGLRAEASPPSFSGDPTQQPRGT